MHSATRSRSGADAPELKGDSERSALIDTNIVSMFLRGHDVIKRNMATYLATRRSPRISIITLYEIESGLAHRDAHKQLARFRQFSADCTLHPLTEETVRISAKIYADLRKIGKTLDDLDLLIAGTALAEDLMVVTRNRKHFDRIEGLEVVDWSEAWSPEIDR